MNSLTKYQLKGAALFTLIAIVGAQFIQSEVKASYIVGAVTTNGFTMKLPGEVIIGDSTVITKFNGNVDEKRIVNVSGTTVYVTDGTLTDQMVISPFVGKQKGFAYDHSIVINLDNKIKGGQIIYWCKRKG